MLTWSNSQSPAHNILVEDIYCNWSGGCAIGSLALDTDISDILYRNVYTWTSNQMMMIKSNEGSGTVENVVFENFIGTPPYLSFFLTILLTTIRSRKRLLARHRQLLVLPNSSWRRRRHPHQHHIHRLDRHRSRWSPQGSRTRSLPRYKPMHRHHNRGFRDVDRNW